MDDLILSTGNPSKAEQIRALLAGVPLNIKTATEAGFTGEPVEDGSTLEENAEKKARYVWRPGLWAAADDTGLFIDALNGEPGIRAARWAGEGKPTAEIMQYALLRMRDIPDGKRTATFKTAALVIDPEGLVQVFSGEVPGTLLTVSTGEPVPKMPYSTLFVPDGQTKTWSQMSLAEENALSHRGKAFRKLREFLIQKLTT